MENRFLIFGAFFVLALLVLGCTGTKDQNMSGDNVASPSEVATEVKAETNVKPLEEAPVYEAPLTGSTDKVCATNSDCRLVSYRTGLGVQDSCMGTAADYKGIVSEKCYCKNIGQSTQTFINGTETVVQSYECRHV
jgi:hypothetical protein